MSVDVSAPALSMHRGAQQVARATQQVTDRLAALRSAVSSDPALTARERRRCEADAQRILTALRHLERALGDAAARHTPEPAGPAGR